MKRWISIVAAAGGALVARAEEARFEVLPHLPGGAAHAGARAVSADGRVVAGYATDAAGQVAVRWVDAVVESIGDLPGGRASAANAVSPNGLTVVGGSLGAWGFVRTGDLVIVLTAPSGFGIPDVSAYGVSADGRIVVGRASYFPARAVRWADGVPTDLGKLSGSVTGGGALCNAVSANSATVVGTSDSALGAQAFFWRDGVMTGLGDLAGGAFGSGAYDVSDDGATIVGYAMNASGTVAARWVSGAISSLGDLPGGETQAYALGVSGNGQYVVGSGATAAGTSAFVWDAASGMRDLNALLVSQGVSLAGLVLTEARAISDDGLTIVGQGRTTDAVPVLIAWKARLGQGPLPCPGDLDGDSFVGLTDLGIVLSHFGSDGVLLHDGDYNCDGVVDISDLGVVLSLYGTRCM